jgi:hypothetical protein
LFKASALKFIDYHLNALKFSFLIFERGAGISSLCGGEAPHPLVHNLLVIATYSASRLDEVQVIKNCYKLVKEERCEAPFFFFGLAQIRIITINITKLKPVSPI